jgi:hypothetical protein
MVGEGGNRVLVYMDLYVTTARFQNLKEKAMRCAVNGV